MRMGRQPEKGWGWFGEGRILYYGVRRGQRAAEDGFQAAFGGDARAA
jgi:hypothetical protein